MKPNSQTSATAIGRRYKADRLADASRLITHWSKRWRIQHLADRVTCEWSSRLTRSLGRAYPARMLVRLSILLRRPQYASLFEEVLCHEVAHLAVHILHGSKAASHGAEWRRLVQLAGYEPRRAVVIDDIPHPATDAYRYEHSCPICHAKRIAKRPHYTWRCVECERAGLDGHLIIRSIPVDSEGQDA